MTPLPRTQLSTSLFALGAAILWQSPAIWHVNQSIRTDSFVTLSPVGAGGLALLTLGLVCLLFLINAQISRLISKSFSSTIVALPLNLTVTLILFTFFWAISPQIFYFYYQVLFDDLPVQWVVRDWFPFDKVLALLLPGNNANTSTLSAGITLVFLLTYTVLFYSTVKKASQ